jgi:hypothetical protein
VFETTEFEKTEFARTVAGSMRAEERAAEWRLVVTQRVAELRASIAGRAEAYAADPCGAFEVQS